MMLILSGGFVLVFMMAESIDDEYIMSKSNDHSKLYQLDNSYG